MNFDLTENTNTIMYYSDSTIEIRTDKNTGRPTKKYIDKTHPNWDDFKEWIKERRNNMSGSNKAYIVKFTELLDVKELPLITTSNVLEFNYLVNDNIKCALSCRIDEFREWLESKKFDII